MSDRAFELPPLELLVAFESAARHLSFTRAGDEIALTQSAVSRQILALEERLGVTLFRRLHRALALTEDGAKLYAATVEVERLARRENDVAQVAVLGDPERAAHQFDTAALVAMDMADVSLAEQARAVDQFVVHR